MKALGYIECNGLSGAIVVADKMLKTADIELISMQNTKGYGWIALEISGDIAAVSVAVETIKNTLPDIYVTSAVFGSPSVGLDKLGKTDLFGHGNKKVEVSANLQHEQFEEPEHHNTEDINISEDDTLNSDIVDDNETITCNLCGDPACSRKLGEPHKNCIHYNEFKNNKNK